MKTQQTPFMWHAAGEGRLYEAAGSRSTFGQKWNSDHPHNIARQNENQVDEWLLLSMEALRDERKTHWLEELTSYADPTQQRPWK